MSVTLARCRVHAAAIPAWPVQTGHPISTRASQSLLQLGDAVGGRHACVVDRCMLKRKLGSGRQAICQLHPTTDEHEANRPQCEAYRLWAASVRRIGMI